VTSVPSATLSSRNCTPTTPVLSLAVADTVTIPETVAPFAGAVHRHRGRRVVDRHTDCCARRQVACRVPRPRRQRMRPAAGRPAVPRDGVGSCCDFRTQLPPRPVETARQPLPCCRLQSPTPSHSETVAPFAGAVIDIVAPLLSIVTFTVALVVRLPARVPGPRRQRMRTRCWPSCCPTRWSRVLL